MKINQKIRKFFDVEPKKLIKQRYRYDCDVACIAMFSGKSYNDIKNDYFSCHDFDKRNMKKVEFEAIMYDLKINIKQFSEFDKSKDAICVVHSINTPGKLHTVYWDATNQEVCDPQRGMRPFRFSKNPIYRKPLKHYSTDMFLECGKLAVFRKNDCANDPS